MLWCRSRTVRSVQPELPPAVHQWNCSYEPCCCKHVLLWQCRELVRRTESLREFRATTASTSCLTKDWRNTVPECADLYNKHAVTWLLKITQFPQKRCNLLLITHVPQLLQVITYNQCSFTLTVFATPWSRYKQVTNIILQLKIITLTRIAVSLSLSQTFHWTSV